MKAWIAEDFGLVVTSMEKIGHGVDENADLWRAVSEEGESYAVKLSGGGTSAGLVVTAHLASHGVPGIPSPMTTRDGRLWSVREGRRLSVVPWVSDDRALGGEMRAEHWVSFGKLLAKVHASEPIDELPREEHTHEKAAAIARGLNLPPEWADPASALLEKADRLGAKLRGTPMSYVVCHGDPHLGNVLLGKGDQVWLIDWDDAILAPCEKDLMFAIGGVLAFAGVTEEQQAWFFDGYGPVDLDPTRLAYYRCARALEDLIYPAAQVLEPDRWSESELAEARQIIRWVLSPTGLATIALQRSA